MKYNLHQTYLTQQNAMKARAYYVPFNEEKFSLLMKDSPLATMLTKWKFAYYPKFKDELVDATLTEVINVPSCWQILGYDKHQYVNIKYPFPYNPPYIDKDIPCGIYETEYEIINKNGKYYINFDGVDSCLYLFVNKEYVGYSTVSHSICEFDITDFLNEGTNVIKAIVLKWCSGSYLEDQDKLRMSGIFRDVYILNRPLDHITDYKITTDFDDQYGYININAEQKVHVKLYDGDKILDERTARNPKFSIENPKLWSAEIPNLYRLVISYNGEYIEEFVGIRVIKIDGPLFKINNQLIKFKGVNRHSMTINGYVESYDDLVKDILLMKKYNVNSVRTSHYPPHPLFTKLCDIYGIYVLEEADCECHGVISILGDYSSSYDRIAEDLSFKDAIVYRQEKMYERDKNRSSVIIWSVGNESGFTQNKSTETCFDHAANYLHKVDNRPVHYEIAFGECPKAKKKSANLFDLGSFMYPDENRYKEMIEDNLNIPYVYCEYTHAMGNSSGDVSSYWDYIYSKDYLCGAFVWEWCDHGVLDGKKVLYGGDFNENIHDSNFCADGLISLDRKIVHSSLLEVNEVYSQMHVTYENGKIYIENKNAFKDLSDFSAICYTYVNGHEVYNQTLNIASIKAGEKRQVELLIPDDPVGYTTLNFEFENNKYHIKNVKQIVLSTNYPLDAFNKPDVLEFNGNIVNVGNYRVELTDDGLIKQIEKAGIKYFASPMAFNIYRPFIDNDRNEAPKYIEQLMNQKPWFKARIINVNLNNQLVIDGFLEQDSLEPYASIRLTYTFFANGYIKVDVKALRNTNMMDLLRFGVTFTFGHDYRNVHYFGSGPYESYEDKNKLSTVGLYDNVVDNMVIHYTKPQESGSHNLTRKVRIGNAINSVSFASLKDFSFSVTPYDQYNLPSHDADLVDSGFVYVNIDYRMKGIGSASCGPRLDDKYRILERDIDYSFSIKID